MEDLWNLYEQLWTTRDQRVDGWLFMSSLRPTAFFIIFAVSVVIWGPRYMKTRPPLNIAPLMVAFNVFVVISNMYIAYQLSIGGYRKQYDLKCAPNNPSDTDDEAMRIVRNMHRLYLCKIVEMTDTFFLIFRKKTVEQIGVLVAHHSGMAIIMWAIVRWIPTSSAFFPCLLNSTAHAVMYTYFGLAFFQPTLVKFTLVKMAFNCFLIVQTFVTLSYCLFVIWIQCPATMHLAYAVTALATGTMLFQTVKAIADYRLGSKSVIIDSAFKLSSD